MSNTRRTIIGLEGYGLTVVGQRPITRPSGRGMTIRRARPRSSKRGSTRISPTSCCRARRTCWPPPASRSSGRRCPAASSCRRRSALRSATAAGRRRYRRLRRARLRHPRRDRPLRPHLPRGRRALMDLTRRCPASPLGFGVLTCADLRAGEGAGRGRRQEQGRRRGARLPADDGAEAASWRRAAHDAPSTRRRLTGSSRSAARLAAIQALYALEVSGGAVDRCSPTSSSGAGPRPASWSDAASRTSRSCGALVEGVVADRAEIDVAIEAALTGGWTLARLEILLQAILRAGAYELSAQPDVPAKVVINEYLEIAHAFFAGKEPSLVNAVLDRLAQPASAAARRQRGPGETTAVPTPDEFRLIARYFAPLAAGAPGAFGLTDDAAVLAVSAGTKPLSSPPTCWSPASTSWRTIRPTASASRRWPSICPISPRWARSRWLTCCRSRCPRHWRDESARSTGSPASPPASPRCRRAFAITLIGGDTVSTPGPLCSGRHRLRHGRDAAASCGAPAPDRAIPSSSPAPSATALSASGELTGGQSGPLAPELAAAVDRALSSADAAARASAGGWSVWPRLRRRLRRTDRRSRPHLRGLRRDGRPSRRRACRCPRPAAPSSPTIRALAGPAHRRRRLRTGLHRAQRARRRDRRRGGGGRRPGDRDRQLDAGHGRDAAIRLGSRDRARTGRRWTSAPAGWRHF